MQSNVNIIKSLWVILGFTATGVGIVGMITPMMPGLVFFLIAAFCFAKGSKKFLRMLITNKYIGPQITDYRKGKGMTVRTKVTAIAVLWIGSAISAFYMVDKDWVKWAICTTAIAVTFIILYQKTNHER